MVTSQYILKIFTYLLKTSTFCLINQNLWKNPKSSGHTRDATYIGLLKQNGTCYVEKNSYMNKATSCDENKTVFKSIYTIITFWQTNDHQLFSKNVTPVTLELPNSQSVSIKLLWLCHAASVSHELCILRCWGFRLKHTLLKKS